MEYNDIKKAAEFVQSKIKTEPSIGIILGSGLGTIADKIENKVEIVYSDIPNFITSTAPGHKGQFVCGELNGSSVICMQGRLHYYEGHSMSDIVMPVRVMKLLGVKTLIVTNAAGGVNLSFGAGDIMLIEDHINFLGYNPLIGPNIDKFGPRFSDMSFAYTKKLCELARDVAKKLEIFLKSGVYLACTGPSFETPAEIRAFRALGADAVGMSTVPEVITAVHAGMNVLGFSLITNMAAGVSSNALSHGEVLDIGNQKGEVLGKLIFEIVGKIE